MSKEMYSVTYEVYESTTKSRGTRNLMLYGPNESEAIRALKDSGAVDRNADVVILDIR